MSSRCGSSTWIEQWGPSSKTSFLDMRCSIHMNRAILTHRKVRLMRTNIEIDDELMAKAMAASEATTKKAVVEQGLQLLVRLKAQEGILKWFGNVQWEGDLDASREGRFLDWNGKPEGELKYLSQPMDKAKK